jgi:hypothetical protein
MFLRNTHNFYISQSFASRGIEHLIVNFVLLVHGTVFISLPFNPSTLLPIFAIPCVMTRQRKKNRVIEAEMNESVIIERQFSWTNKNCPSYERKMIK